MNIKLYIFILILIFINFYNIKGSDTQVISVVVSPSSYIIINGNTNISSFDCNYSTYHTDPVNVKFIKSKNRTKIENAQLSIPVEYIDCHNPLMNNDLKKLLNASATPDIIINISDFHEKKIIPDNPNSYTVGTGSANINVTIAGVTNEYEVEFADRRNDNEIIITGSLYLNLNNFGLTPSKILFGTIRLKEMVKIDILLKLLII
jgi:hypothetical protein